MESLLGVVYCTLIVLAVWSQVSAVCARCQPLRPYHVWLNAAALLWAAAPLVKMTVVESVMVPVDAVEHEYVARKVAELLGDGLYAQALGYFSIGNPAYRFLVGVFYAITGAPQIVVYAVNGALAFAGLLSLLEVSIRAAGCSRAPAYLVLVTTLLPTALLWAVGNLKEGAVLWGTCSMLFWLPQERREYPSPKVQPVLGLLLVGLLRPHIACIWIAAVALASILRARRFGTAVGAVVGGVGCVALVQLAAPDLYAAATSEGVASSLNERFDQLSENDDLTSRHFAGSRPIPVYTGLTLIALRPWPTEVASAAEAFAGAEVWLLALMGAVLWCRTPAPGKLLSDPAVIGMLFALFALGFYFSYMYNMGLVVRQRLMAFPALILLYFFPALVTHRPRRPATATPRARAVSRRTSARRGAACL